ncbi:ER membrane protein [Purpureocillium lavendulum]|uniref:ER membrane protein n=1 Tax=Purpureocillium lavendulum TaxID=1247861 RepID=A0AB34G3T9_9HYPO|nr:ER membrane protein [Purpureocillium lavendulum]
METPLEPQLLNRNRHLPESAPLRPSPNMSLDLEKHLTFYGAYHHNSVNVAIHMVCVPLILVSAFCMLPPWLTVPYLDLNLGTIAALLYAGLYILLEPVAGFVLAAFCVGSTAFANHMRVEDPKNTFQIALVVHIVSWIAQFIGHGAFEGRAPALLDNLIQAVFLAPMFVWLEVLFKLGYRKELQTRVEKQVQVEIAKFKAQSKNGKAQ